MFLRLLDRQLETIDPPIISLSGRGAPEQAGEGVPDCTVTEAPQVCRM